MHGQNHIKYLRKVSRNLLITLSNWLLHSPDSYPPKMYPFFYRKTYTYTPNMKAEISTEMFAFVYYTKNVTT